MALDRADRLARYLDETSLSARFWEESNCILFPGRWTALEREDVDVTGWIGACRSGFGAGRIVRAHGDLFAFASAQADAVGLERIDHADARLGDVALFNIEREGRSRPLTLGAIRTASRWAIRTLSGVTTINVATMRAPPAACWRV